MPRQNQQLARLIQELLQLVRSGKLSMKWLILLGVCVVGYLLLQPMLERKLGLELPGLSDAPAIESLPEKPAPPVREAPPDDSLDQILSSNSRAVYLSPAGLKYTRGSQHGHRVKHLLAHAKDIPDRPGQHGVFDLDEAKDLIALVDEAYQKAIAGKDTTTEQEGSRTVYDVDMRRRIGYIGGESGNRRGRPAASHMRLVLDGTRVITAFPIIP